tara:strand:- start:1051 stop:1863 length:813 start_codon:yes stop_codon:yes gene_type:complete
MFTPIGFFSPQGGSFDPTLGGTLSVNYHWDFTDSSTMTLSGTDVTDITDKVGSITLLPNSNAPTTPAVFATDRTLFNASAAYAQSTTNLVPPGMERNDDFTVVYFAQNDFDALGTNAIIAPWDLQGGTTVNQAQQIRPTQFYPGYDPYSMPSCGTGTYYFSIQRFDGGWTGKKQKHIQAVAQADKNMVTVTYNYTGTQLGITVNDNTLCTISDTFFNANQTGDGFIIGGRQGTGTGVRWYGEMYHTIVYPSVLSQTNINDLYASWVSFNA